LGYPITDQALCHRSLRIRFNDRKAPSLDNLSMPPRGITDKNRSTRDISAENVA
jgi:hypothetical protein|tara:strand:- start:420 stop:581 length:162 start_codon:yes stop_codon:yes gene_type:complete